MARMLSRPALRAIAPIVAVLALMLASAAPASAGTCAGANSDPATTNMKVVKRATLCLLNQQRHRYGLRSLKSNGRLSLASQRHANDMTRRKYFEHGNFVGRIKSARYLQGASSWTVGENIAWGSGELATPKAIVRAWMNSPGHRHNILNRKFREIGLGVARGVPIRKNYDGATYATDFGARGYPHPGGSQTGSRATVRATPSSFSVRPTPPPALT
jgi:uncharacterized protein YkwD